MNVGLIDSYKKIECYSLLSCANSNITTQTISCNGPESCKETILSGNSIKCEGMRSCSDSIITTSMYRAFGWFDSMDSIIYANFMYGFGHGSLAFAHIRSRPGGMVKVFSYGYKSGYGVDYDCVSGTICRLFCLYGGCENLHFNCFLGSKCFVYLNGTMFRDPSEFDQYDDDNSTDIINVNGTVAPKWNYAKEVDDYDQGLTALITERRLNNKFDSVYQQVMEERLFGNIFADEEEEDESERYHSQSTQSSVCSDIEDEKKSIGEDNNKWNLELQRQNLAMNGYCKWPYNKSYEELMIILTSGYVRIYYEKDYKMNQDIYQVIKEFYGTTLGLGDEIKLRLGTDHVYLTTITNISLSKVLSQRLEESDSNIITVDESKNITCDSFEHALMYLGHHEGVEPDPLPCPVRSIHMRQICSDRWDADWMDAFAKKTIFEIIMVANDLDIKPLLHLGCAKIATLIKQMDQKEINRIIEEEEKYRREHANDNNNNDSDDQKMEQTVPTAPSVAMLDELVSIFDHDYQIEYNEEDENEDENENETRIQGIDDEEDKVEKRMTKKSNNPLMNQTVAILDELLLAFDC
mmetsp:Transcript_9605/g.8623  ORF Transcript_9605/g.8623 Transcript_9605/m.8623 type:complete len:579 (-) Transcript_9605:191-1927(-)